MEIKPSIDISDLSEKDRKTLINDCSLIMYHRYNITTNSIAEFWDTSMIGA